MVAKAYFILVHGDITKFKELNTEEQNLLANNYEEKFTVSARVEKWNSKFDVG